MYQNNEQRTSLSSSVQLKPIKSTEGADKFRTNLLAQMTNDLDLEDCISKIDATGYATEDVDKESY